jgi:putative transposase
VPILNVLASCSILVLLFLLRLYLVTGRSYSRHGYRRKKSIAEASIRRNQAKPLWVKKEIIRLAAFMPDSGCRKIADSFNAHYKHHQYTPMTIGKTLVGQTIKQHLYDISMLRNHCKHRIPKQMSKNIIWATDLTTVTDSQKQQNLVLGILDHGSRACLLLEQLPNKASITLLRCLLDCVEQYGKPKCIRTDNEAVFVSRLFRAGLWLLNIKHQRTPKHSPWMKGRIERFFWTFKNRINKLVIENADHLHRTLPTFRFWYNHVRSHQHLYGKTPAQIWSRQSTRRPPTQPQYFTAWDTLLAGFYFPPPY